MLAVIGHRVRARSVLGAALRLAVLLMAACGDMKAPEGPAAVGDAEGGRLLLRQYGCGACHRIPGVVGAHGRVGPPLEGIASRVYLAGVLPNTPEHMVRWIREPDAVKPGTAMPSFRLTDAHARDMVAYLQRLR